MADEQPTYVRLRNDLGWTLHPFADGASYTVVNPATAMHFQLGIAEYALASMLDGKTTIAQAAAATRQLAAQNGDESLGSDDEEAKLIVRWLLQTKLAARVDSDSVAQQTVSPAKRIQLSPLSIKMRLGNPRRLVDKLARWAAPLTNRGALVAASLMIACALWWVISEPAAWSAALQPLWAPAAWWQIGAAALLLRVLHEVAHAVLAQRFNVAIDEVGILWILFLPLPYVDLSQSWQRQRRRERILIAGAGMLAELTVAAIAILVLALSNSAEVRHFAATVALTASIVTLVFNANVLMRFDGYHMLVDLVGMPNLYADASAYWRQWACRIVLGKRATRVIPPTGWLGLFFRGYGLGALLWRAIVCVGLLLAAEYLFRGAGVLLAIAALGGLSKRLVQSAGAVFGGVRPARAALGLTIMGIVGCVIWSLPLPRSGIETGVVRYLHPVPVRTASDGWVKQILVRRGQRIRRGDLVATLQNLELRADVAKLQYDLASATLRHRRSLAGDQMAAADAEWSNVCRLSEELELLRLQLSQLQIRAPTDGVVAAGEDLPLWLGRHVPEGTELLQLTQPGQWEICLAVDQGDHQRWTRNVGKRARVGRTRQLVWTDEAEVVRVAPTASDRLPAAALGANHGGPLAVRGSTAEEVRLTHPRFEVNLQPTSSLDLRAGQTVQVRLPGSHSCLGDAVVGSATNWVRNRLSPHSLVHQFTNL